MKKNILTAEQQQLVIDNMNYAQKLACGFTRNPTLLPDLQQESLYGLCQAAIRYRPGSSVEFTTFAYMWCCKYIIIGMHKFGFPMVIPVEVRKMVELLDLDLTFGDLDDGDDDGTMADRLLFTVAEPEPECDYDKQVRNDTVKQSLRVLTPRERKAIICLFGLDCEECNTALAATAMRVSPSRIRDLKQTALRKLELYFNKARM